MSPSTEFTRGHRLILELSLLIGIGLLLILPSIGTRDLWLPDEPRYAQVAREMVLSGNYLVPHLNGEIYPEKPPLFFWLSALLQQLGFGVNAGRLVSGTALIGTILLTRFMTSQFTSARAGLLAGVILATTYLFGWIGRLGVLDLPLCFFTTLSALALLRARNSPRWIVVSFAALALGVLTKGPVALLFWLTLALSLTIATPRGPRVLRSRNGLFGIFVFCAILAAWLIPACLYGGAEYTETILLKQSAGRVMKSFAHLKPWHYYLVRIPIVTFPWCVLLPGVALWQLREWKKKKQEDDAFQSTNEASRSFLSPRILLVWLLLSLIVFSLISGKRERYLTPLLPPLAILLTVYLEQALSRSGHSPLKERPFVLLRGACGLLGLAGASLILVAAAWPWVGSFITQSRGLGDVSPDSLSPVQLALSFSLGAGILCLSLFALHRKTRTRMERLPWILASQMILISIVFDVVATPTMNDLKSPRLVAIEAMALLKNSGAKEIALFPQDYAGAFNLYLGRIALPVLQDADSLGTFLEAKEPRVVIARRDSIEYFGGLPEIPMRMLSAGRIGRRQMVFLVNDRVPKRDEPRTATQDIEVPHD